MNRMIGQTIVMTGAGSGIGRASALECAREGARVAVADIRDDPARRVAAEIESEGNRAIAIACDVTDAADVQRMMKRALDEFGQVNALFNGAGIDVSDEDGTVETCSEETWAKTLTASALFG